MFETYRMLGREREDELVREAERLQRTAGSRPRSWKTTFSTAVGVALTLLRRRSTPRVRAERIFEKHSGA
jgi:hypothetical protein